MIETDEDALICDLAETYGIYDYRSLPLRRVAAFSVGLRNDSRIKQRLSGRKHDDKEMLLATIADRLALLIWMQTKDGQKNRNRPPSIVESLSGTDEKEEISVFDSLEEFEAARMAILREGG